MRKYRYITWLFSLMMIACSSDDIVDGGNIENSRIELSFLVNNYIKGSFESSTNDTTVNEQTIENLYIFLFSTTNSQDVKSYYISAPAFIGGSLDSSNNKISLSLTQSETGVRDVYIIANCSSALQRELDEVATIEDLQSILQSSDTPWSSTLSTPILMSGNATHNFNSNYQLNNIPLIRALSKVQLNIKLSFSHQDTLISTDSVFQYKYRLINFDKNTYVLKPISKNNDLVSTSAWINWNDQLTSFTLDNNNRVTSLILTTYLNESDDTETAIELCLPYIDGGFLPPPEFGNETYKLQLPAKIERNHWYVYDIEI